MMVLLIWLLRGILTVGLGCLCILLLWDDEESNLVRRAGLALVTILLLWGVWFSTEIGLERLEVFYGA